MTGSKKRLRLTDAHTKAVNAVVMARGRMSLAGLPKRLWETYQRKYKHYLAILSDYFKRRKSQGKKPASTHDNTNTSMVVWKRGGFGKKRSRRHRRHRRRY